MPNKLLLDTLQYVETPEGIKLKLPIAGPVVRALAWVIDTFIRLGVYILAGFTIMLIMPGGFGIGILLIIIFITEWFYPVGFEVYRNGATPGKSALGIQVLSEDGTPINLPASMIRNLLRTVDFMPILYGFGLLSMLLTRDFKRLGDLVAGSIVIYSNTTDHASELPSDPTSIAPPHPLTLEEQQALISFAERSTKMTDERNQELAELTRLSPSPHRPESATRTVLGIARWIAGHR